MENMSKQHHDEEEDDDVFYSPAKTFEEEEEERNEETHYAPDCRNDELKEKLEQMRLRIQKDDSASKVSDRTDDLSTLKRFLVARDLDVEKATEMFFKYCKWRRSFVPNGSISASDIRNELAGNKVYMQGVDRNNRPVAVIFGARHFPCKGGMDEFKRFVVFAFDKACSRTSNGQDKFTIIGDVQGYGYSNIDVQGYIATLSILQDYYPERLGKLFIINAPYAAMVAWKMIYPFVDKNTRKKILFVEKKKLQTTLLEEIDANQLPEIYGGKMKLIPIQDA